MKILFLVTILYLSISACSEPQQAAEWSFDSPFLIGHLARFSDPCEDESTVNDEDKGDSTNSEPNAVNLAVTHVDEILHRLYGDSLSAYISIEPADTKGMPSTAKAEAERLLKEEGVNAIIGASRTEPTKLSYKEVSDYNKEFPNRDVVQISHSATATSLSEETLDEDDRLFRTIVSDDVVGKALARLIIARGYEKPAVIYIDNDYGRGLFKSLNQELESAGREKIEGIDYPDRSDQSIVSCEDRPKDLPKEKDWSRELEEIKDADVLVALSYASETVDIVDDAIRGGFFNNFLFADRDLTDALLNLDPPWIDEVIDQKFGGVYPGAPPSISRTEFKLEYYCAEKELVIPREMEKALTEITNIEGDCDLTKALLKGTLSDTTINQAFEEVYPRGSPSISPTEFRLDLHCEYKKVMEELSSYSYHSYDAAVLLPLAYVYLNQMNAEDRQIISGKENTLASALRSIGTPSGEPVGLAMRGGLSRAFELVKQGIDINYVGVAGPQDFNELGDVETEVLIIKVVDGQTIDHGELELNITQDDTDKC